MNPKLKQNEYQTNVSEKDKNLLEADQFKLLDHFVGRSKELTDLDEFLKKEKGQFVYIHGMSGCGKSSLAEQFASKISQNPKHVVIKIKAINKESIENGLKRVAKNIKADDDEIKNVLDDGYMNFKRLLNKYLKEKEVKLFLIFDDLKKLSEKFR